MGRLLKAVRGKSESELEKALQECKGEMDAAAPPSVMIHHMRSFEGAVTVNKS